MFELKKIQEFPIKKCKNFGYTFSVLFLLITLYFFFSKQQSILLLFFYFYIFFSVSFFFANLFKVTRFLLGKIWNIIRQNFFSNNLNFTLYNYNFTHKSNFKTF